MYTSPDEARSDLFLAGAVYIFGPTVVGLLLSMLPVQRIPGLNAVLLIALPLAFTLLVPYLLIRYRHESLLDYGLGGVSGSGLATGALVAAPIVAAGVVAALLAVRAPIASMPLFAPGSAIGLIGRLTSWIGVAGLAVYGTVKARDAFRSEYRNLREGVWEVGRILVVVALVSSALLVLAAGLRIAVLEVLLLPVGVAGAVWVVHNGLRGPSATTRATLVTPAVLLALGPFQLALSPVGFVYSVWEAALAAGIGLAIGSLVESRRSAWPAIGAALVIACFSALAIMR